MPPKHKHGFPSLFIQLLKQEQRFLFQSQTAFLVAVHNVQGVLSPIVRNIISLERLFDEIRGIVYPSMRAWTYHRKDDPAGIVDADAEGFEDFDLGVVSGGGNGLVVLHCQYHDVTTYLSLPVLGVSSSLGLGVGACRRDLSCCWRGSPWFHCSSVPCPYALCSCLASRGKERLAADPGGW